MKMGCSSWSTLSLGWTAEGGCPYVSLFEGCEVMPFPFVEKFELFRSG